MKRWSERSPEVAYLLNPAFCSVLIYSVVKEYLNESRTGMPFVLVYLTLPLILHKKTRESIESSKTRMITWIQRHPEVLVNFPHRAKSLIDITNESLEFLLSSKIVILRKGKLNIGNHISNTSILKVFSADSEMEDCLKKTKVIGKWFSRMKNEVNIYAAFGVKP